MRPVGNQRLMMAGPTCFALGLETKLHPNRVCVGRCGAGALLDLMIAIQNDGTKRDVSFNAMYGKNSTCAGSGHSFEVKLSTDIVPTLIYRLCDNHDSLNAARSK